MVREILLLGNENLYDVSEEVRREELPEILTLREDLKDTVLAYREKYGVGRAIAAPQVGVKKRVIFRLLDTETLFINPVMEFPDEELYEVMDDCMSFPGLLVKVLRHKRAVIRYKDEEWNDQVLELEGDMSELLQHEYDHLDGILAVMRAIDRKSYVMNWPGMPPEGDR